MAELPERNLVVGLLNDLQGLLPIRENARQKYHLFEIVFSIVGECRRTPSGLTDLVRVLGELDAETPAMAEVRKNVHLMTLPPDMDAARELFALHAGVDLPCAWAVRTACVTRRSVSL